MPATRAEIEVDINAQGDGALAAALVRGLLQAHPATAPLIRLVKAYMRNSGLNDPAAAGLNSYSLISLCVFHLQTLRVPCLPPASHLALGVDADTPPPPPPRGDMDAWAPGLAGRSAAWRDGAMARAIGPPLDFAAVALAFFVRCSALLIHHQLTLEPVDISIWRASSVVATATHGDKDTAEAALSAMDAGGRQRNASAALLPAMRHLVTALCASHARTAALSEGAAARVAPAALATAVCRVCAAAEAHLLSPRDAKALWRHADAASPVVRRGPLRVNNAAALPTRAAQAWAIVCAQGEQGAAAGGDASPSRGAPRRGACALRIEDACDGGNNVAGQFRRVGPLAAAMLLPVLLGSAAYIERAARDERQLKRIAARPAEDRLQLARGAAAGDLHRASAALRPFDFTPLPLRARDAAGQRAQGWVKKMKRSCEMGRGTQPARHLAKIVRAPKKRQKQQRAAVAPQPSSQGE